MGSPGSEVRKFMPALSDAILNYQKGKHLNETGIIDNEFLDSLGMLY